MNAVAIILLLLCLALLAIGYTLLEALVLRGRSREASPLRPRDPEKSRAVMRGRSADDADRLDDDHGWTHVLRIHARIEIEDALGNASGVYEIQSWSENPSMGSAILVLERCDGSAS